MNNDNPPSFTKMIKDLRSSGTGAFQQTSSSSSFPLNQDSLSRSSTASENNETPKRQKLDESGNGMLIKSDVESVPGSPWEWRKMKGELIALKTRLSHQEATVQQLHKVRREMEEIFNKEKKILEIQVEENKQTIKQLELRVNIGRQAVHEAKSAQAKAERDLSQSRMKMEGMIQNLSNVNRKLTEQLQHCEKQETKTEIDVNTLNSSQDKLSELNEKFEAASKRIIQLEEKLRESRVIQQKSEVQSVELQNLKRKIETLEAEKALLEDNKSFISRAAQAIDLERELNHAKEIIVSLRESVKGKLLLEEQMANIEHRLKRTENLERQVSQLEVSQAELLAKIAEYEAIGITGGPIAVKREISRLQHAELLLTNEECQLRSKVDSLQKELISSQQKHEETKKLLTETSTSHERLTRFISRLQKKLSLVTRERDSYRNQLDTYEKEITGYQNNEAPNVINERIPALERAIEGYRELVAKLESDLEAADGVSLREEVKKLKEEIDRLKGELEHRALKGDFNINTKILHFKMNPAAIAEKQAEEKQKVLLQEVEQLRAIVSSGNHSAAPAVSSLQAQEIAELQQKHEIKISRLKEAFKASSHEYRQACYQLFGWRVDRTKEGQYKLSSQYAESPDDYLFFIVNEDGVNMIETPFSATLTAFIDRHLKLQHSVPMFLNAVQSDLFDQQTVDNAIN